uniref:G-protein coupled receptors family 1 profile domain-containing protein n=1 Tax=Magallana gigas TaxID=29159 RepID=K1PMC2_MAGGI
MSVPSGGRRPRGRRVNNVEAAVGSAEQAAQNQAETIQPQLVAAVQHVLQALREERRNEEEKNEETPTEERGRSRQRGRKRKRDSVRSVSSGTSSGEGESGLDSSDSSDSNEMVLVISIFGIVGNVLTLSKIVFDKAYHRTVFYVIGSIIFTDLVNLCLYFIHARIDDTHFTLGDLPCKVFLIVFYGATHSSAAHVVLLFGLRSYMVSEPIKFNKITMRHLIGASAVLWILIYEVWRGNFWWLRSLPG